MSFSCLHRILLSPLRLLRRTLSIFFGSVRLRWSPPGWAVVLVRHPRWILIAIVCLTAAGYGGSEWYRPREANHPHPRELVESRKVEGSIAPIVVPGWDKKASRPTPSPLVFRFHSDAAPIDEIGKEATENPATNHPAVKGVWKW